MKPLFLAALLFAAPVLAGEEADPDAAAMSRTVDELLGEVARVRGLEWKSEFARRLFSPDELRKLAMEMLDKELPPDLRVRIAALDARLGFYAPGLDIADTLSEFLAVGAAGFYDPDEKTLQIQRGFSPDGARPVIFHELVHALEDQHFDLKARQDEVGFETDRGLALSGLVEGSATWFMGVYIQSNLAVAMEMMKDAMKQEAEQTALLRELPVVISVQMGLYPYLQGMAFVQRVTGGDPAKVTALYSSPPVSSEQVMHPEKYGEGGDYPHRVRLPDLSAALPEGWKAEREDTIGELSIGVLLNEFMGGTNEAKLDRVQGGMFNPGIRFRGDAKSGSEGWDGDRVAGWFGPDGEVGIAWVSRWDTPEDAAEFAAAYRKGEARKRDDLKLERPGATIAVAGSAVYVVEGFPEDLCEPVMKALRTGTAIVPDWRDGADVAALRR